MQKLHHVRPKEDIEAANRPFAENTDDELPKIDSKDAAHVADQVRRTNGKNSR
jgi:hypothetical protein